MADVNAPVKLYTDSTGVNVFAEATLNADSEDDGKAR